MKYLTIFTLSLILFSCEKKNNNAENNKPAPVESNHKISMEQDTKTLTGSNGEKLTVTYFAEGIEVAVKVNKNNEGEHQLKAKGVTDSGNPLFSDGQLVWEMSSDGQSGTLTEKGGKVTVFK